MEGALSIRWHSHWEQRSRGKAAGAGSRGSTGRTRSGRGGSQALRDVALPRTTAPSDVTWRRTQPAAMTKLGQWLCGLALLGSAWAALALAPPGLRLPAPFRQALLPLPVYLLVAFGCYALATVGYRLATFNDCEEAAAELREHVRAARADLARRGLRF